MASTYRYAVKVIPTRTGGYWGYRCEGCDKAFGYWVIAAPAADSARRHAARCSDLHRANWDAACPSCKAFGKIAPACPCCLGRGWVKESAS